MQLFFQNILGKIYPKRIRAVILFFFCCFFIFWLFYIPKSFSQKENIVFKIEKGEGVSEISLALEKNGIIKSPFALKAYVYFWGINKKLQAGGYLLSPSMSVSEIAGKFAKGDIAKTKITIPEGYTALQIKDLIFEKTGDRFENLQKFEGYLFPDTYEIIYGGSEEYAVKMMTDNFEEKTAGMKITPEIVKMASILEKEVRTKEDKEIVAGILQKRMEIKMPLQVDACLWTYENLGLPPSPISNPGMESITAALNPKDSPYLYYLSAPDGKTIFSRTFEEHKIAKARYLK